jgi:hypothetical protein
MGVLVAVVDGVEVSEVDEHLGCWGGAEPRNHP